MIFSGLKLNPLLAQNNCSLIIIFIMTYVSNKMQERERKRKENCYLNKERNAGHFVVQIFILQEYFLYSLNFIFRWKERETEEYFAEILLFSFWWCVNVHQFLQNSFKYLFFSTAAIKMHSHYANSCFIFISRDIFCINSNGM